MADWTGAQSSNFAPADGDRITGALTVNNGVTWTWNAGVDLTETGYYAKTIDGRIVANLTLDNPGTIRSSSATPLTTSCGYFIMNAVDAGCVLKGLIFYHQQYGIYFDTPYTAHNCDVDNIIFDSCASGLRAGAAACTTTWGAIEVRNCNNVYRIAALGAAQTTTYASLWVHDCNFGTGYLVDGSASGTINITELIVENCTGPGGGGVGWLARTAGSPVLNITKIWMFNCYAPGYVFAGFSATGTLNVDGGIIHFKYGLLTPSTAEANITFDNVDIYLTSPGGFVGSGNYTNCYFEASYSDGTATYAPGTVFQPADTGGIADDVSSYNSVPFITCDSITSARAAPNYPLTNASELAVSSVTSDGAVFAYTPGCPGETTIFIYDSAKTITNWWDLADYQGIAIHSHFEWHDRSGNNQKIHQLTSRSRTLDNMLTPGTAYKARVRTKVPWGHTNGHGMYWGAEQPFTTDAAAASGGLLTHAGMTGGMRG